MNVKNRSVSRTLIRAIGFIGLVSSSFGCLADIQFRWTQSGGVDEIGYNQFAHRYPQYYARPDHFYGLLNACDTSFIDNREAEEYRWEIKRLVPGAQLPDGRRPHVKLPFFDSGWTPACRVLMSGVSVGTIISPEGEITPRLLDELEPKPTDQMKEIFRESNLLHIANRSPLKSRRPNQGTLGLGHTTGEQGNGPTRPSPPPPPLDTLLMGPHLDRSNYRITLTARISAAQTSSVTNDISVGSKIVAILGDSLASGEGNPDYYGLVAPAEISSDLYFDGLALAAGINDVPGVSFVIDTFASEGKIQVGSGDLLCKVTKAAAFYIGEPKNDYDPVQVTSHRKKYGMKMQNAPGWLDLSAHRSHQSGHARSVLSAAKKLRNQNGWTVRLITLATSGAEVPNVYENAQKFFQQTNYLTDGRPNCSQCGQLDELSDTVGSQPIDLLVISAGANDVGFSHYVKLAMLSIVSDIGFDFDEGGIAFFVPGLQEEFNQKLAALRVRYRILNDRISEKIEARKVVLTGYPIDIFSNASGTRSGCGVFKVPSVIPISGISKAEATVFKKWGKQLRDLQKEEAQRYGWEYVQVDEEFEGHGYCTGVNPGIGNNCALPNATFFRSAERSCVIQGNLMGALHPNYCGHSIYEKKLLPIIEAAILPIKPVRDIPKNEM